MSSTLRFASSAVTRHVLRPGLTTRAIRRTPFAHASRISYAAAPRLAAAFSTSRPAWQGNEELVSKLEQELTYEKDRLASEEAGSSSNIKEYLSSSDYQLEDIESSDEVSLVRTYGDEQIKVTFSTNSLTSPTSDIEGADPALYDEGADPDQIKQAPEDEIESDEYQGGSAGSLQVQTTIQISRGGGKGAIVISAFLNSEAQFIVEQIAWYPTAELAEGKTAEDEMAKRNLYTGPPFEELDENLQGMFEEYLEERGINTAMATFIPEYIDQKESQEYTRWIQNMKNFLE